MVVLDFYLVAEYGNIFDDGLNELVFLDGIHEVPDSIEVRKGFADLFRSEVATILVHALRLRENPQEDLRLGQRDPDVLQDDPFKFIQRDASEKAYVLDSLAVRIADEVAILGVCPYGPEIADQTLKRNEDYHWWTDKNTTRMKRCKRLLPASFFIQATLPFLSLEPN